MNPNYQLTQLAAKPNLSARREPGAANASPQAYLVQLGGALPGRMIRVALGEVMIGRSEDNALPVFNADVSRRHAMLRLRLDGSASLLDLGSTNGTFRNGERLLVGVEVPLNEGDKVQFGPSVLFKFTRPSPGDEKLLEVLFERASRDALTGLYNRAYYLDQVPYQMMRGLARSQGLGVILVDIDHFKQVNDTHGHAAGDDVLKAVARILHESVRGDDMVARYGGEEFIIALTTPDGATSTRVAESIRKSLASQIIRAPGVELRVTASFGIAFAPPGQFLDAASLIETADRALYLAKQSGRNRVVWEPWPTPVAAEPANSLS
jgi:diguanylate cyclase (GGDEF)-like protein